MIPYILIAILALAMIALVVFLIKYRKENLTLRKKYDPIINMDTELENRQAKVNTLEKDIDDLNRSHEQQKTALSEEYSQYKKIYDQMRAELAILEENLEMTSYGIYEPHYEFDTSERYKIELDSRRQGQKLLVKNNNAAVCNIEWTVDGSAAKGRKQTRELIKLLLRAFNNECDSGMLKVKWNNVTQMEQRITRAYDAINKLGTTQKTYITQDYLKLKLEELFLTHEYQLKRYEEQEEQKRIREQIREEERAQKEFEKAKKEAETEERRYETALQKARADVEKAGGKKLDTLNEQILLLEKQLEEAHANKERAVSRAQLTKSGYVYIISNLGSFGKNMYKIGMTRRLDPMDRVRELGDASVPFQFDVHAMIDCNNAPDLENKLHKIFNGNRVNLVNTRKEYFFVTLAEIEKAVHDNHGDIEFTKIAEAREFRQSEDIRASENAPESKESIETQLPESLIPGG